MRAVFVGASTLSVMTVRALAAHGHESVIIERDRARIDALADELDCGFVHGDGSRPAVLRDVGPRESDILLCLSNDDQDNIIASLVGRALGFGRVVTRIEDPDFEHICTELGLDYPIVPDRETARALQELCEGHEPGDLTAVLRGGYRLRSVVVGESHAGVVDALPLPDGARCIAVNRGERTTLPEPGDTVAQGDQLLVICPEDAVTRLREAFAPEQ